MTPEIPRREFNPREALQRWLQIAVEDIKSFGRIQVIKREFRDERHMKDFLEQV